jgi:hypothetical protein
LRDARGGRLNDARFGARFRGAGARWAAIEQIFSLHARRLGLELAERCAREALPLDGAPETPRQGRLF